MGRTTAAGCIFFCAVRQTLKVRLLVIFCKSCPWHKPLRAVSVFPQSTLLAKSEQNASAKSEADSSHLPKFCPECNFCWTMPPGCAKTMSGTRNGADLQVKCAIAGFLFFWESVKKLEEAFLMKACSPLRSEHKQRNL